MAIYGYKALQTTQFSLNPCDACGNEYRKDEEICMSLLLPITFLTEQNLQKLKAKENEGEGKGKKITSSQKMCCILSINDVPNYYGSLGLKKYRMFKCRSLSTLIPLFLKENVL